MRATNQTLHIEAATGEDLGQYRVVVSNGLETRVSELVFLRVIVPPVMKIEFLTVSSEWLLISCTAQPGFTYTFYVSNDEGGWDVVQSQYNATENFQRIRVFRPTGSRMYRVGVE